MAIFLDNFVFPRAQNAPNKKERKMPEIKKIEKVVKHEIPRVCAYVRVSTDSQEQLHSYAVQKEYWDGLFQNNDRVAYLGMYSDEGISGYKTVQRNGFKTVMKLARDGKIDTVYTKSFTRFSRNMVDGLDAIEILRGYGVNVIFEKENIDSFDPNSRFTLNLLARVAEEDLHSISKNVSLSIRHRIQKGKVLVVKVYGYNCVYNKKTKEYDLTVNPSEAVTIKKIYELYLSGLGMDRIAKYLTANGYVSPSGNDHWSQESVNGILKNEKYIGDTLMQKTYTENFMRKENKNTNPDAPLVLIENTHEPIISREDFKKVQEIRFARIASRKGDIHAPNPEYAFKSKIQCGECGKNYIHRVVHYKGQAMYHLWSCNSRLKYVGRIDCKNPSLKDSELRKYFVDAYEECCKKKIIPGDTTDLDIRRSTLLDSEKDLNMMVARGFISKAQFKAEVADIIKEIGDIENKIAEIRKMSNCVEPLKVGETVDDAVRMYLDKVIVRDWTLTFVFINGYQTTRRYTNGTAGGQKGNNNTIKNKKRAD